MSSTLVFSMSAIIVITTALFLCVGFLFKHASTMSSSQNKPITEGILLIVIGLILSKYADFFNKIIEYIIKLI
ncbi:hypothetical protein SE18_12480 [Herpetosiphon geysericola]|uniref:Uncharacterized protein n=1 Tax=Herpetosiphon geysericola TaxID=70996 RepID=A0A0P6Y4D4_9CHLR|nr:hypothetical protein SE18_12480 [Herpetosiphon geysericola]